MNAGAHGGEFGSRVVRFRCLDAAGAPDVIEAVGAGFGYRCCASLANRIAWQVTLSLQPDTPEAIRARRLAFRERRLPLAGFRTAGSVFCNPPGHYAGRLLDESGCKGVRIGGAAVSERHANIVVAGDGATASDVLALLTLMRQRVQIRAGIRLELENRMLGLAYIADGLAMD
jgi:UDP-N-acetylmuramate dehydrogenase